MQKRIKTIHIDDDSEILNETEKTLQIFSEIDYLGGFSSIEEAYETIEKQQPDLIILDMELGSSISFTEIELRKIKAQIVVLSGHSEYAINAFQFNAVHYILKPSRISDFQIAIEKVKENLDRSNQNENLLSTNKSGTNLPKRIVIGTAGKTFVEPVENIIYIEADASISLIHLADERVITSGKIIKFYKEQFSDFYEFMEISRSAIVNLNHVKVVIRDKNKMSVKMSNGEILSVSVNSKEELLSRLEDKN